MAGSPMTGGTPQQARPLDQGRYVGNPNHMIQAQPMPTVSQTPGLQGNNTLKGNSPAPIGTMPSAPMNINTMAAQGIRGAGIGTAMGMGYTPQQVSVAGNSATVTPQTLAGTNMQPYMNPYDDAVVQANEADILRGAQMGMNTLQGQAQAAGAFGGSRHGVAMGEIGRDTVSQLAQASSNLRQAGYQNAQQAALADIRNNMQGQLANQQAGMGDISNQLQASLANQQAGLSGAGQRLSAANQLGQIANLGFGMGQTVNNNMMAQGAMQQALQQNVLDAAANKYQGYVQHPAQGLAYLNAALGVTPTTPQTTTTTKQPGLFDYLTLGASGYTGS